MKERLLLDTNVIVRYFVGDHEAHQRAAEKVFEACDRGDVVLVILPEVLSECVFVLESFYKHPREKIAGALKALVENPGIAMIDEAIHVDGLKRYAGTKLHFVDCTLAAYGAAGQLRVATFDREFGRLRDVKILNPAGEAG